MARGLGKGLDALISSSMEDEDSIEIVDIPLHECRPNPYQPRKTFTEEAIEELKQSILEHGIIQPIIVRASIKGYEIVVGERRFRAAQAAELDTIPAIVEEMNDEKMMELALLENLQREDLTPVEEANAYENLMNELKLTQEDLSKRLGKSRSHIANTVRLLTLPEPVIEMINTNTLSMGHGRTLLSLKDKKKILPVAERIVKEKLNVRQVERLIQQMNEAKPQKKDKESKDIFLIERETSLRERFGTSVKIHKGKRKGKIEIEFYNDDDLERIIDVLEK